MAAALPDNDSLAVLNLWGNRIGAEGMEALGEALGCGGCGGDRSSVTSLDARDNALFAEGVVGVVPSRGQGSPDSCSGSRFYGS